MKDFYPKHGKNSQKSTIRKQSNNNKWTKGLNRYFAKEDIEMAKKHMKKCLTLLVIKEMKSKTTMRYHFTRMAKFKPGNVGCRQGR